MELYEELGKDMASTMNELAVIPRGFNANLRHHDGIPHLMILDYDEQTPRKFEDGSCKAMTASLCFEASKMDRLRKEKPHVFVQECKRLLETAHKAMDEISIYASRPSTLFEVKENG